MNVIIDEKNEILRSAQNDKKSKVDEKYHKEEKDVKNGKKKWIF